MHARPPGVPWDCARWITTSATTIFGVGRWLTASEGDCYARIGCGFEEIAQSLRILKQAARPSRRSYENLEPSG